MFLDEAEALTPRGQVVLLRVLQERTVRPLEAVQAGRFRSDLYYRLCVFSVNLPPLRERREHILPLAEFFIAKHARTPLVPKLSAFAADALLAFEWPGNVRELESAIVRAVHLAPHGVIQKRDLGLSCMRDGDGDVAKFLSRSSSSYRLEKRRVLDAFERRYLTRLMKEYAGNMSRAARAAGKERRDLGKLLKRHGFDPRRFAAEAFVTGPPPTTPRAA